MPYITPESRKALDVHIANLAQAISAEAAVYKYDGAFGGILNYAVTSLILQILPGRRYWVIAMVCGVLVNIKDEFYRRYAAKYEDEMIAKNGDVY